MPSFRKSGLPKHWKELIKAMTGPKPMNPIFRNFLKAHEPVDIMSEVNWKLWEYSENRQAKAVEDRQGDQSSEEPPQPKRPIVGEQQVFDDEVDYGNSDGQDSNEPDEEAEKTNGPQQQEHDYSYSTYSESYGEVDLRPNTRLTENDQAQLEAQVDSD